MKTYAYKAFAIAAVFCIAFSLSFPLAFAQGVRRVMEVVGRGEVSTTPDTGYITFGISTLASSAAQSVKENALKTTGVITRVKGILGSGDKIQTTGYSLLPEYSYSENKGRELMGYRTINMLFVETKDIQKVGEIIDAAIEAGANTVESVRFGVENATRLKKEALSDATRDAMEMAAVLAEAGGVEIGKIVSISPDYTQYPITPRGFALEAAKSAMPTPIEPGELTVSATVRVVFEIK